MKTRVVLMVLCLLTGLGTAQAQLKIDFNQTGGAVQDGYQGYFATDKDLTSCTAQSYSAFGTTVTVRPTWASNVVAACVRVIDRGVTDVPESPDLLRDWIGTDTRQNGDPMTLTISGLPAGAYEWVSYHHDRNDQTGIFQATVNDATGSKTTTDLDISNGTGFTLANVTKFTATIISDGQTDVTIVFDQTSASSTVANAIFVMNGFDLTFIDTGQALSPSPVSGATDIPRDGVVLSWIAHPDAVSHDVYIGMDQEAVEDAASADAVYMGRQDATTFELGRLAVGQVYYWRVDEVKADGSVSKGSVWSFTVEPLALVLAGDRITATASGANSAGEGPEKTIDGSGLSTEGFHSTETTDMWLSAAGNAGEVWIQYQFDKIYKLHQMLVWNHNSGVESIIGVGAKDVTVDYSIDGADWTTLEGADEFAQASGDKDYAANTTVEFGGAAAQYVRITIATNWGDALVQRGLSEVRFLVIPTAARLPEPADGATEVAPQTVLAWRAGRDAVTHRVYLSTDVNEVTNGTALVGTVSDPQFDASSLLSLNKTYYWKVDEVNELIAQPVWEGEVWSFSTSAVLTVDDMESYNDAEDKGTRIYETWADGWGISANGSQVGHDEGPFAEVTIFHGGAQSMPLYYGKDGASYSEATRTFDGAQDWTLYGVKGLVLWFYGDPTNTAGQLYVKINGKKVVYDGDAENVQRKPWQMWYIDLAGLTGVNLKKITDLVIGVDGGEGRLFIDDIGLSPLARQVVTPVAPAATNLMAKYTFEGNVKDSVGSRHGTVEGAPTYVDGKVGQAIKLDGARDYVMVESTFDLPVYTAALWFRVDGGTGNRALLSIFNDEAQHGVLLEVMSTGGLRFLHRAPVGSSGQDADIRDANNFDDAGWHHVAIVKSVDSTTLYIDGRAVGSAANATPLDQALTKMALGMLKYPINTADARYFPGAMDEVYLYGRVLSDAEIASLAGRTKPFDKP